MTFPTVWSAEVRDGLDRDPLSPGRPRRRARTRAGATSRASPVLRARHRMGRRRKLASRVETTPRKPAQRRALRRDSRVGAARLGSALTTRTIDAFRRGHDRFAHASAVTEPFRDLAAAPRRRLWLMDCCSHYFCDDGEIASNPGFAAILADEQLICIRDGAPTWSAACRAEGPWPDDSATTLGCALMWLPDAACRAAVDRVVAAGCTRSFTRAEVRARRRYARGRVQHLGPELDAVALRPTKAERIELEAWLAVSNPPPP